MSNDTKIEDANDWLEKSIKERHIKCYDYNDIKCKQSVGSGSFGIVFRINHKDRIFALKSFFNDKIALKEIVEELDIHRNVDDHDNIIRFYGVAKTDKTETSHFMKYALVLEYADGGSLNEYLCKHFNELEWNDKYQLALQLASAVEYIHECDIIHRDLNANNILVNQKKIKLADFGLSKKIAESSNRSGLFGVIPYIDPKSFDKKNNLSDKSENYKLNKKSDVYSIGVLLWQISSGHRPFYDFYPDDVEYDLGLALAIKDGEREKIIDKTPVEYSDLYSGCWKCDPNERPDMQGVVLILKKIISPEKHNEEKGSNSLQKSEFNSTSNKESSDINEGLTLDLINFESGTNLSSQRQLGMNIKEREIKDLCNNEKGSNSLQKSKFNSTSNKESSDVNEDSTLGLINSESGSNLSSQQSQCQLGMNKREVKFKDLSNNNVSAPYIDEVHETLSQLKIRNLLIVGHTGSGKSTLANVLSDSEFEESEQHSISNIKHFRKKNFEFNMKNYCVADTIGNELTKKSVIHKIAEIIYLMPEGISQVLFVVDGKFTVEEMEAFELFEKAIFDSGIIEYTTIVRTKFSNFNNKDECEKDKEGLHEENNIIDRIVKSRGIIYVDNPPINIRVSDDDDKETIRINEKRRIMSRKVLLDHLEEKVLCQEKSYKLKKWNELHVKIKNLLTIGNNITKDVEHSLESEIPEPLDFDIKVNFIKKITANAYNLFKKLINYSQQSPPKKGKLNLLIIGRAGSGKSTLENVLVSNPDDSARDNSTQEQDLGLKYQVIDTTGVRGTKQSIMNIFNKIEEVPEGVNQVLFVVDGTFKSEEIRTFEKVISENDIVNYITIVRTKFSNFKSKDECEKDRKDLRKESKSIAEKIIYVDNPPINIIVSDDDDEETIRINKKKRIMSRKILLDHLENACQKEYYKLKTWYQYV